MVDWVRHCPSWPQRPAGVAVPTASVLLRQGKASLLSNLRKGEAVSELSTSDTAVLDLLERMTADPVKPSSLDGRTMFLVRLAALVASDAPTVSYAQ